MRTEGKGVDLMLVCQGINWFDGTLDDDDTQWFSPHDVVRASRVSKAAPPHPLNFL